MDSELSTAGDIEVAERQIGLAEHALEAALENIARAPRADKTTVSGAVELALERLHAARSALAALHELISPDK